jgi:RNA polymerase sigma factor (sigma-70 family)
METRTETQTVEVSKAVETLVDAIEMDTRDHLEVALDLARTSLENIFWGKVEWTYLGIEDSGYWGKAWKLTQRYHEDVEDMYQELVAAAIELVRKAPSILEKGAGYLLQAATWRAQNAVRKYRSTYLVQAHQITVTSLDIEDRTGSTKGERAETPMVDLDLKVAVKQVVANLDETDQQIARYLMDGYKPSEVAGLLGVTRAAITYRVKHLRKAIQQVEEGLAPEPEITTPEPATPVALRKAWWTVQG